MVIRLLSARLVAMRLYSSNISVTNACPRMDAVTLPVPFITVDSAPLPVSVAVNTVLPDSVALLEPAPIIAVRLLEPSIAEAI